MVILNAAQDWRFANNVSLSARRILHSTDSLLTVVPPRYTADSEQHHGPIRSELFQNRVLCGCTA